MNNSSNNTEFKSLQTLITNTGIIVGLLYSIGFLIASIYLSQINLRADKILSTQYITIGILFTIHLLVGVAVGLSLKHQYQSHNVSKLKQVLYTFSSIPFLCIFLGVLYVLLFSYNLHRSTFTHIILFSSMQVFTIVFCITTVLPFFDLIGVSKISLPNYPQFNVRKLVIGVFFLGSLSSYAIIIYPSIPDTFGGGQMKTISFQFKDKLPIHAHNSPHLHYDTIFNHIPYNLAGESERDYYILIGQAPARIIIIPKDLLISSLIGAETTQSLIYSSNAYNFADTTYYK